MLSLSQLARSRCTRQTLQPARSSAAPTSHLSSNYIVRKHYSNSGALFTRRNDLPHRTSHQSSLRQQPLHQRSNNNNISTNNGSSTSHVIPPTATTTTTSTVVPSSPLSTAATPRAVPMSQLSAESFLNGTSASYEEHMYETWKNNPDAVHASWKAFFDNLERGVPPGQAFRLPPSLASSFTGSSGAQTVLSSAQEGSLNPETVSKIVSDSMRVLLLIRSYQVRGHVLAKLDPLGLTVRDPPPELQLSTYGFTEADLDKDIYIGSNVISGFLSSDRPTTKLRDLIKRLQETYCGSIGVEYIHIQDRAKCNWIRDRLETPVKYTFSEEEKEVILDRLTWATQFERFAQMKWGGVKRFGLDGCESLIPGIKSLIDRSSDLGVEHVVMGMPHRGRLNVLANVVRKPLEAIFHEFEGGTSVDTKDDFYSGSGDVKYHLGTSCDRPTRSSGKRIHISLLANPSHLEAVDPVVEGKARARQFWLNDEKRDKVMSILLHGDASFAAQGIVYETMDIAGLPNYTTGGTIHIIVNNQVGFTTDPRSSRASIHCTDVAKAAGAPIFHVNGDDPEAVVHVFKLAAEWRQTFHNDVVIDIVCYRRYGHNEGDEPRFTQPLMYKQIDRTKAALEKYIDQLMQERPQWKDKAEQHSNAARAAMDEALKKAHEYKPHNSEWLETVWKGFRGPQQLSRIKSTGVPEATLQVIGRALCQIPDNFKPHPQIKKLIEKKKKMFDTGEGFDWGTAEALAFGSLLLEKNHVRLSGQDVERGTFSHRHAVIHDQQTDKTWAPLTTISPDQEKFVVTNSSLSEFGVLGFELGYSLERPNALVLWEAQFGDFANGAQVIIDQFISSGEAKWKRQTGLVMLLPHGYDGQGPEHSSARLERFLQMSHSDPDIIPTDAYERVIQQSNWQVMNITTPANYFHALRRQIHRDFRKPLVVMSPKNLLKLAECVSNLKEFSDPNSKFIPVFGEQFPSELVAPEKMEKVIFCSGKVYYELIAERKVRKVNNTAIVRIEELYPFPFQRVLEEASKYPKAQAIWLQEEPKNQGAWTWIAPHLRTALKPLYGQNFFPTYVGRPASAAPATGIGSEHKAQWKAFMDAAFAAK